jgi:hypothetical protein
MEELIQEWPEKLLKRDKLVRRNRDVRRQIVDNRDDLAPRETQICITCPGRRFTVASTIGCHECPAVWGKTAGSNVMPFDLASVRWRCMG